MSKKCISMKVDSFFKPILIDGAYIFPQQPKETFSYFSYPVEEILFVGTMVKDINLMGDLNLLIIDWFCIRMDVTHQGGLRNLVCESYQLFYLFIF